MVVTGDLGPEAVKLGSKSIVLMVSSGSGTCSERRTRARFDDTRQDYQLGM
jgi:hypothetical protein